MLATAIRGESGAVSLVWQPPGMHTQNGPARRWPALSTKCLVLPAFYSPGLTAGPICDVLQPPGGPLGNRATHSMSPASPALEAKSLRAAEV